ncbi:MAG: hypothetical protein QHC40_12240 [Sphingobium sp.]|nr:hypothetical protein [Sphingobium sp.]
MRALRSLLGLTIVLAGSLLALKFLYAWLSAVTGSIGALTGPAILVALIFPFFLDMGKGLLPPRKPDVQDFSLHPAASEIKDLSHVHAQ